MKAVCIGSCNIDYTYTVDSFLAPGETKECIQLTVGCGGKGLNQVIALAQAGVDASFAGLTGDGGQFLRDKMVSKGVDISLMEQGRGANGHALIQVDRSGQNCILLYGGTNRQFSTEYIDHVLDHFSPGDIVVLQNEINHIPYIIHGAAGRGLRVAFNAAPYDSGIRQYPLEKVTWLIVNEIEGAGLAGVGNPEQIMARLRSQYPETGILLTLGKEGCLYGSGTESIRMPACEVEAVDTTAAGDTFIGFFICGITQKRPMTETLRLASAASGLAITKPGAADSIPDFQQVMDSGLY